MEHDPTVDLALTRERVMSATRDLDGSAVRDALLDCLLVRGVDATVTEVVMPVLRWVGDEWEAGRLGVVHEHFVSNSFRGVLGEQQFAVDADGNGARTLLLACPPRELHDLPLELFGAMMQARWWRVVSLGANTPMTAIGDAVRFLGADACVLAGVRRSAFEARLRALSRLGRTVPLFIAGEGAHRLPAPPEDVTVLPRDLVEAAQRVDRVERAEPTRPAPIARASAREAR